MRRGGGGRDTTEDKKEKGQGEPDQRFKMFITITACHQLLSVRQRTATQIQAWLPLTKPPYLTCPPVPLTRPSSTRRPALIASLVLLPERQLCCKSNIKSTIKKKCIYYFWDTRRQQRGLPLSLAMEGYSDGDGGGSSVHQRSEVLMWRGGRPSQIGVYSHIVWLLYYKTGDCCVHVVCMCMFQKK